LLIHNIADNVTKIIRIFPYSLRKTIINYAFRIVPSFLGKDVPLGSYSLGKLNIIIARSLLYRIDVVRLKNIYGECTGRFIVVKGGGHQGYELKDLGLACSNVRECEIEFRKTIEKIISRVNNSLKNLQKTLEVDDYINYINSGFGISKELLCTFMHEYIHWMIISETSVASVIDALSWRFRFDEMALAEVLYRETGLTRNLRSLGNGYEDINEALKAIKKYEKVLEKIGNDKDLLNIFNDLVTHVLFLYIFYGHLLQIIVEPVTWALWRDYENIDELFKGYFDKDIRENIAREVFNISNKALNEKKLRPIDLIEIAKKTLNIPLKTLEDIVEERMSLKEALELMVKRLRNLVNEIPINEETNRATILNILSSILRTKTKSFSKVLDIISEVLAEEPEVLKYILGILARKGDKHVYSTPSVFLKVSINNDTGYIRYDPWSDLAVSMNVKSGIGRIYVKRTNRYFQTLEDIIGDVPLIMRSLILILGYPEIIYDTDAYINGDAIVKEKLKKFRDFVENTAISKRIRNFEDLTNDDFTYFLKILLTLIYFLGESSKELCGLHGLYF